MRQVTRVLAMAAGFVLSWSIAVSAADARRDRNPDAPPKVLAQVGETLQRTGFHTASWGSRSGGGCVVADSYGIPSERTKIVAPGRRSVRVAFLRALKPAKVRLSTYSRRTGPGEYAGRERPRFELRRFRDRRDRAAWRIVFAERLAPGEYLRGEFYVRYPDTDGCGSDEGVGAFTFRAARPRD